MGRQMIPVAARQQVDAKIPVAIRISRRYCYSLGRWYLGTLGNVCDRRRAGRLSADGGVGSADRRIPSETDMEQ